MAAAPRAVARSSVVVRQEIWRDVDAATAERGPLCHLSSAASNAGGRGDIHERSKDGI